MVGALFEDGLVAVELDLLVVVELDLLVAVELDLLGAEEMVAACVDASSGSKIWDGACVSFRKGNCFFGF